MRILEEEALRDTPLYEEIYNIWCCTTQRLHKKALDAAKKLGFSDAEEMIVDGSLGHLKRVGINPLQDWV